METVVVRRYSGVIDRPIDEVRAQYCDMQYHVAQNVHTDIRFTIHDVTERACRFSQEISLAGMRQIDEIINTVLPNGDLRSEFVTGMNEGGTLRVHFEEASANATRVTAGLRVPLRGVRVLLAPILAAAAQRALEKAFSQDKRDLEAGNYSKYQQAHLAHS
jgi:hypothetical protein